MDHRSLSVSNYKQKSQRFNSSPDFLLWSCVIPSVQKPMLDNIVTCKSSPWKREKKMFRRSGKWSLWQPKRNMMQCHHIETDEINVKHSKTIKNKLILVESKDSSLKNLKISLSKKWKKISSKNTNYNHIKQREGESADEQTTRSLFPVNVCTSLKVPNAR